jgi:anti-sigma regulatory factor (Ser/Thr protein kinase)
VSDAEPLTLTTVLPADENAPRSARDQAADLLARLAVDTTRLEDVALVVSELVSNAVIHGPGGALEVRLAASPILFRIEVQDGGVNGFEWHGPRRDDHWGLELVRVFSDRSGVTLVPSTVAWSEIDLQRPSSV